MDNLDIFLLIIAAVVAFKTTSEIFTIQKTARKTEEAHRFFNEMSSADKMTEPKTAFHTSGLTLCKKKKDEKYTLLAQSKLTGLGLA